MISTALISLLQGKQWNSENWIRMVKYYYLCIVTLETPVKNTLLRRGLRSIVPTIRVSSMARSDTRSSASTVTFSKCKMQNSSFPFCSKIPRCGWRLCGGEWVWKPMKMYCVFFITFSLSACARSSVQGTWENQIWITPASFNTVLGATLFGQLFLAS